MSNLTEILPRHQEIMRRIVLGHRYVDIAEDLGLSYPNLLKIISDPLFQSELRSLQSKRDERIFNIQEELFDAALSGARLHRSTIEDSSIPLETRLRSASTILTLVGRITRSSQPSAAPDDTPYERRFREVIFRESSSSPVMAQQGSPPSSAEPPFLGAPDDD